MKNKIKKSPRSLIYSIGFAGASLMGFLLSPMQALANSNITDGLGNAGVGDAKKLNVTEDFDGAIVFIVAIAAIWTIACILFAAMKISGSQGNGQKRVEGIIGLAFAGFGAWVIFNAYNIYGWFSNIGEL